MSINHVNKTPEKPSVNEIKDKLNSLIERGEILLPVQQQLQPQGDKILRNLFVNEDNSVNLAAAMDNQAEMLSAIIVTKIHGKNTPGGYTSTEGPDHTSAKELRYLERQYMEDDIQKVYVTFGLPCGERGMTNLKNELQTIAQRFIENNYPQLAGKGR